MPFRLDRMHSLLLLFFWEETVVALSMVPGGGGNNNIRNDNVSEVREIRGGNDIGIRPELSKDSYAHRSAIGNSFGTIDVRISSEEKGLGAFATSSIPFGTLLGKYNGEIMDTQEVKARFWNKATKTEADIDWEESRKERNQAITGHFLFELPNGSFVDAEDADKACWIRFMNHADQETVHCNCKAFIKTSIGDQEEEFPLIYTISDISAGDELCWDYGGNFFL